VHPNQVTRNGQARTTQGPRAAIHDGGHDPRRYRPASGNGRDLADAAEHFDESALSALVSIVALTNVVNGPTPRSRPSLARRSSLALAGRAVPPRLTIGRSDGVATSTRQTGATSVAGRACALHIRPVSLTTDRADRNECLNRPPAPPPSPHARAVGAGGTAISIPAGAGQSFAFEKRAALPVIYYRADRRSQSGAGSVSSGWPGDGSSTPRSMASLTDRQDSRSSRWVTTRRRRKCPEARRRASATRPSTPRARALDS
jgi:hypothetical protein